MNENPISDTTFALHLEKLPIILEIPNPDGAAGTGFRAVILEFTDPDGAAGTGSRGEIIPLGGMGWVFGEDVPEKGFQDRHAAAYQTGVDFDDTARKSGLGVTERKCLDKEGKQ